MSEAMSEQVKKLDAAEYVIGTLSAAERAAFEGLMADDAVTRADVRYWEYVFGSLNASIAPEAPPASVWKKIETQLGGASEKVEEKPPIAGAAKSVVTSTATAPVSANDNAVEVMRRSRGRWKMGAIAATIAALGLGAFILNERGAVPGVPTTQLAQDLESKSYVAVVSASGDQPALVVNVDAKTGVVSVRRVGVETPEGKNLELWYLPDGKNPTSVGVVEAGIKEFKGVVAKPGDILAISVEPVGGSPTGTATGPVVYTGKLVEDVSK